MSRQARRPGPGGFFAQIIPEASMIMSVPGRKEALGGELVGLEQVDIGSSG
jgi:hypothetical protein